MPVPSIAPSSSLLSPKGPAGPEPPVEHPPAPRLKHILRQQCSSVLSLITDGQYIYSGGQTSDVSVWDRSIFVLKASLRGHSGAILALELAQEKKWLFSSSGDSTVRIWSTRSLSCLYVLNPWLESDAGDIFTLAWCPTSSTIYLGCQNTSVQFFDCRHLIPGDGDVNAGGSSSLDGGSSLSDDAAMSTSHVPSLSVTVSGTGSVRKTKVHKFFNSYPQYERKPADALAVNGVASTDDTGLSGSASPVLTGTTSSSNFSTIHTSNGDGVNQSQEYASSSPPKQVVIESSPEVLDVLPQNAVDSAHFGYVYCMALIPSTRDGSDDVLASDSGGQGMAMAKWTNHLVTGSGDETLKVWRRHPARAGQEQLAGLDDGNEQKKGSLELVHVFEVGRGAVLSVVTRGETVFAGCQDGYVTVWDLETRTLVRAIIVQENAAILSLSMVHSDLYTCAEDGSVQRYSAAFERTASWSAHDGIVLSSVIASSVARKSEGERAVDSQSGQERQFDLITGGNDEHIKVWEIKQGSSPGYANSSASNEAAGATLTDDSLVVALSAFVSYPSVSGQLAHRESCRQAAIWLRKHLVQLGAMANLASVSTGEDTNPLVLATFKGAETSIIRPRILFYGHYDVIRASSDGWDSDPYTLSGRNGYLYGRGATDNKGPILALAAAASELLHRRSLAVDLVFLVEGEEERGSGGFEIAVRKHRDLISHVDAILVSNSTWIAEYPPCITYGLRGVVHCGIEISSGLPDLHSGVEGGAVNEPMFDMVKLLSSLTSPNRRVLLPGFYQDVRPVTEEERRLYKVLSGITQRPASLLAARWSEPALTVHKIDVSGPNNSTVIPGSVRARLSLRIVPDQDLEDIATSLIHHLETAFEAMTSSNHIDIRIDHKADWWLGSLDDPWFQALEGAVRDEWGVNPLRIREGGSIPSIPFLEKEFKCHALHLPLGQSTDQAHLPNERISLANLRRGKSVFERFLSAAASLPVSQADHNVKI